MLVIEKRVLWNQVCMPRINTTPKDPASSYSSLQKSCPNYPSVVFATFCNDDLFQEYALFVPQDAHEKAEQTKTNQPTRKKTKENTNAGSLIHHVDWVSNLGKLWEFPRIRVLSSWDTQLRNFSLSHDLFSDNDQMAQVFKELKTSHGVVPSPVARRLLASWFGRKIGSSMTPSFMVSNGEKKTASLVWWDSMFHEGL